MKRIIVNIMVLTSIFGLSQSYGQGDPSTWNAEKLNSWFQKGDWHKGWAVTPDPSIDKAQLAKAYFKNSERWNKAFAFLKNTDMTKLELKRHDIDGDNIYLMLSEYKTKNPEDAKFEAHKLYIDIQYVVSGNEMIGMAKRTKQDVVLQQYDAAKDIEFLSVKKPLMAKATPERFFIFFPDDAHEPGVKIATNDNVRKAVIKIKID